MDDPARLEAVVAALRRYGASHAALMRQFADSLSVHPTDAAALAEVFSAEDRGQPLSPAALALRLDRSRPAVSAVLNRLEGRGLIERRPAAHDRRGISLHAGAALAPQIGRFFAAHGAAMQAHLGALPAARVAEFTAMLDGVTAVIERLLQEAPDRI